jgi:hypothetical protein
MPPFETPMRASVGQPGSRSSHIDIRMWSPRTFTRILAFEISLSPNLNLILESRVIFDIPWGDWSPFERNAEPAVGKVSVLLSVLSINGTSQKLVEDHRTPKGTA